jgi:hypothetical protein
MKQLLLFFFLPLCIFLSAMNVFSQNNSSDANRIIDIEIHGLKRTKPSTAEEPLLRFLGTNAEEIDVDEVHAAILGLGILDPLEVTIEDAENASGKILRVNVHEKWSIFPLPAFSITSSGYIIGAMFMDSNAFGVNDKFALGGMFGTVGWMAALMYFHQGKQGIPGWNAAAMYSNGTQEYQNQNEENIRFFPLNSLTLMTGINYDFTELISSSANLSFYMGDVSKNDESFSVPDDDAYYISTRISSRLGKDDWDGYFLSQKSLSASFEYSFGILGPSYYTLHLRGNLEQSIFPELIPGLKALIKSSFIFSPDAPPLRESGASSADIDILPRSFSAQNYLGGSAGLEKSLYKFSFGTLSAFTSYQLVFSDGPILGENVDHGITGGIRFYMSKLAMPALGFGVSYNVAASYFQGYFNLGMTM